MVQRLVGVQLEHLVRRFGRQPERKDEKDEQPVNNETRLECIN
jgi:hypothetical protein